ncbi:unnamed protein product [Phytomonas sp. Hart1]|nr:unnamed protein product [Phytomonas sp. Hart1]|eukprot:CCW68155.1 unnamed protein product [Phytomonas sp. isolate Hart1]
MASAQQISNSFVTEFFERVAKNPANLAELYGRNSVLHIHDFEMGIKEICGADVSTAAQEWAALYQGNHMRVESVSAAPIYGGVNVFVTFTAVGELQQYFHVLTTLEAHTGFNVEGYYIRHQVVSRIGAIALEAPPVEVTPGVVEQEPVAPAVEAPVETRPEEIPAQPEETTPTAVEEEALVQGVAGESAAVKDDKAPITKDTKLKSWASLVSSSAKKGGIEGNKPIRVVAVSATGDAAAAATAKEPEAPAAKPSKVHVKREKRPMEATGDRLMFNIDVAVSDEEIKVALGSVGASLLSLRNNSERGYVFMDFAPDVKALEELKKLSPIIGTNKTKMNVFRQRPRE